MTQKTKRYKDSFTGYFAGIIPWEKFDLLWGKLKESPEGWYVFQPNTQGQPPTEPMEKEVFLAFLQEVDEFLHEQQYADYCGCVYVNSTENPAFVKVFHPRKMGSGCSLGGSSKSVILPWWTISKVRPEIMLEAEAPQKKGFINKILER